MRGRSLVLENGTFVRTERGGFHEWTVRFDDGRVAYLASAAGTLTLFEEAPIVPAIDGCVPGRAPMLDAWVVVERGESFVELSSRSGKRATIDYGTAVPRTFVGARVTADELGIVLPPPIFHAAPEISRPQDVELHLPIGESIDLEGTTVDVLGFVRRAGPIAWDEYAIYDERSGVRWLVLAEGHWTLAEAVEPGLVVVEGALVRYGDVTFRDPFEMVAHVVWATGELPWIVKMGDEANLREWQSGDATLALETTPDAIGWTLSRPVAPDVMAKALGKRALPRPQ
jgi:hypothetical protein